MQEQAQAQVLVLAPAQAQVRVLEPAQAQEVRARVQALVATLLEPLLPPLLLVRPSLLASPIATWRLCTRGSTQMTSRTCGCS